MFWQRVVSFAGWTATFLNGESALLDFLRADADIITVWFYYSLSGVIWIRPDVKKQWLRVVVDQLAT